MKLIDTKTGLEYNLNNLDNLGRTLKKRLLDLGLIPNCKFKVIVMQDRGPVLLEIKGTRIAIGRGMAEKIEVREVERTVQS